MRVLQIGNFRPPHSTESHLARALEFNGHDVTRVQEDDWGTWYGLANGAYTADFALWTRTGWNWESLGIDSDTIHQLQHRFLLSAARRRMAVVGYHLDIWWGLVRETQVGSEPFFSCSPLITADGGHEQSWEDAHVDHVWMPPGVSLAETEPGMYRSDLASPLAFVGSHDGGYHPESKHRHELVAWLKNNFRRDCAFWPQPGQPAVRGNDLRDLYTSVDVVVGDSCFTGTGLANYWSDRIPETVGRGGFLLHPMVEGLVEQGFTSETMGTWDAFDWDALGTQIEWALSHPSERKDYAAHGREMVRERHTYEVRMDQLVELLQERGALAKPKATRQARPGAGPKPGDKPKLVK